MIEKKNSTKDVESYLEFPHLLLLGEFFSLGAKATQPPHDDHDCESHHSESHRRGRYLVTRQNYNDRVIKRYK